MTEIEKIADQVLSDLKKDFNHITTQLTSEEKISYNTGFLKGFKLGHTHRDAEVAALRSALEKISKGCDGMDEETTFSRYASQLAINALK